jgi:TPR repeat protein
MRLVVSLLLAAFAGCALACSHPAATAPTPPPKATPKPETPEVRACLDGKLDRCFEAGQQLQDDPAHRKQLLADESAGCERHVAENCFRAGMFSAAPEDLLDFMSRACQYGMAASCRMLGGTLAKHASSRQLVVQAIEFLALGCKQEDAASCVLLAGIYEKGGPGLAPDPGRAVELYQIACSLHESAACSAATSLQCRASGKSDCAP